MRKLVLFFLFTFCFSTSVFEYVKAEDEFEEVQEAPNRLRRLVGSLGKIARSRVIQAATVFVVTYFVAKGFLKPGVEIDCERLKHCCDFILKDKDVIDLSRVYKCKKLMEYCEAN